MLKSLAALVNVLPAVYKDIVHPSKKSSCHARVNASKVSKAHQAMCIYTESAATSLWKKQGELHHQSQQIRTDFPAGGGRENIYNLFAFVQSTKTRRLPFPSRSPNYKHTSMSEQGWEPLMTHKRWEERIMGKNWKQIFTGKDNTLLSVNNEEQIWLSSHSITYDSKKTIRWHDILRDNSEGQKYNYM